MIWYYSVTLGIVIVFACFLLYKAVKTSTKLRDLQENYDKLVFNKKSSEVRIGHLAEKLAPILEKFPEGEIISLGMPIDYMIFGKEHISIVEVKFGKSKLSAKQRHIRNLVNAGKVRWKLIRIK